MTTLEKMCAIAILSVAIVIFVICLFGGANPTVSEIPIPVPVAPTPKPLPKKVTIGMDYWEFKKLCNGITPSHSNIYESRYGTTVILVHDYGTTLKTDPTGSKGCAGTFTFFDWELESVFN